MKWAPLVALLSCQHPPSTEPDMAAPEKRDLAAPQDLAPKCLGRLRPCGADVPCCPGLTCTPIGCLEACDGDC